MKTGSVARALARLAVDHAREQLGAGREVRLIFPAPTRTFAVKLHAYTRKFVAGSPGLSLPCYLVVPTGKNASRDEGHVHPAGLTSLRIGSFIAVLEPGQLSRLQDSVRGTGGAQRGLAIPEEWPWVDDGLEAFRFNGPVMDRVLGEWLPGAENGEERDWLRTLVIKGLLPASGASADREVVLLDEILEEFDPDRPGILPDPRKRFLFHAGIPAPADNSFLEPGGVEKFRQTVENMCRKINERCQKDPELRDAVLQALPGHVPPDREGPVREALGVLLDGVSVRTRGDVGILSLHGCWGGSTDDPRHWLALPLELLAKLFDAGNKPERARLDCKFLPGTGHVASDDGRHLVVMNQEVVRLVSEYELEPGVPGDGQWSIALGAGRRTLERRNIESAVGREEWTLVPADHFRGYRKGVRLRVEILQGEKQARKCGLLLDTCGAKRRALYVVRVRGKLHVGELQATGGNGESEEATEIKVGEPADVFILQEGAELPTVQREDRDEQLEVLEVHPGVYKLAQPVVPQGEASGRVPLFIRSGGGEMEASVLLDATDVETGYFTIEEEVTWALHRPGGRERLEKLEKVLETGQDYGRFGAIREVTRRRKGVADHFGEETGFLPHVVDWSAGGLSVHWERRGPCWVARGGSGGPVGGGELPAEVESLVQEYASLRSGVLELVGGSSPLSPSHPAYAVRPLYREDQSAARENAIRAYLEGYRRIYEAARRQDLDWSSRFVLFHLDCIVPWSEGGPGALFLLGPWHPLVVGKRYLLQKELLSRARQALEGRRGGQLSAKVAPLLLRARCIHWVPTVGSHEDPVLARVVPTNDPGWHLCHRIDRVNEQDSRNVQLYIEQWLGLSSTESGGTGQTLTRAVLAGFGRVYPSRRAVSVAISDTESIEDQVREVEKILGAEGEDLGGKQLPGGAWVFAPRPPLREDELGPDGEEAAALLVFTPHPSKEADFRDHVDIRVLPPGRLGAPAPGGADRVDLARGNGGAAILSSALHQLKTGPNGEPMTKVFEGEPEVAGDAGDLGTAYREALRAGQEVARGHSTATVWRTGLREGLRATWTVIPGALVDPAAVIRYVLGDGGAGGEGKSLWDYRVDLGCGGASYYVLTPAPTSFRVAIGGIFPAGGAGGPDPGQLLSDLARVGVAVGGETMRSGRHAHGVIGLVGAIRLLVPREGAGGSRGDGVRLVFPVDAFESFFGTGEGNRRADLLVLELALTETGTLRLVACAVEAKFKAGTYPGAAAGNALDQAEATIAVLEEAVGRACRTDGGGLAERLWLSDLVRFGFGIRKGGGPAGGDSLEEERTIQQAILSGKIQFRRAGQGKVLVTTETGLSPGESGVRWLRGGNPWIRLSTAAWPGSPGGREKEEECRRFLDALLRETEGAYPGRVVEPRPTETVDWGDGTAERTGDRPVERPATGTPDPQAGREESPPVDGSQGTEGENGCMSREVLVEDREQPVGGGQGTLQRGSPTQEMDLLLGTRVADGKPVFFDPVVASTSIENPHLMVTGSSGMGKTQFVKYLACRLRELGVHVLLFDFKNDFASDDVFVGRARLRSRNVLFDGMPYNPLVPYPVPRPDGSRVLPVRDHARGIAGILQAVYKLGTQQARAFARAIMRAYGELGITGSLEPIGTGKREFPSMEMVGSILEDLDTSAFSRLEPLFDPELFQGDVRNSSFEELAESSIVLDFTAVRSDELRNALAQLVVMSAHGYYNSLPSASKLRQYLVFDEAHRVLKSEYMEKLARESRSYGIGIILSSQYPGDFPSNIRGTMATKVLHGNGADLQHVRDIAALLGGDVDHQRVSALGKFQAYVDNQVHRATLVNTMHFPLWLAWSYLLDHVEIPVAELRDVPGVDTDTLPPPVLADGLVGRGLAVRLPGERLRAAAPPGNGASGE